MGALKELKMQEYDENLEAYQRLETIVAELLEKTLKEGGIHPMQIAHRIKSRDSVAEKMERKPEKYSTVSSMTDLIGFRIICYFSEQVDQMAELVSKVLRVFEDKISDKRKLMAPTAFGYLSLHYICALPKDQGYPEDLTEIPFEIQFRTVLQHAWAEIEHDLGYKSEFSIPLDVRREFSRVAGLLEIADEYFGEIKKNLSDYVEMVHASIEEDRADDLKLDMVSLTAFMERSKLMNSLTKEIAALSGAVITPVAPDLYLERFSILGIRTLGDLTKLIEEEHDHAIMLAEGTLAEAELDTLASTVGLYYILKAKLVFGNYREEELRAYYKVDEIESNAAKERVEKQVRSIYRLRERYGVSE